MSMRGASSPSTDPSDALLRGFEDACESLSPLASGVSLILGCSAGGDSVALLDIASRVAPDRGWRLAVAHLDHAQRAESGREAGHIAKLAREAGIHFISEKLEGGSMAPASEDKMREARHEFFHRAMAKSGATALLLAHQADDRAETFLMRLLSGSGPTGLASIRAVETVGPLTIARPLLDFRREELRDYLRARGLQWFDDPTNEDLRYKRAWVRAKLIPMLNQRMSIDVTPRLVRASELAEEESAALDQASEFFLGQISSAAAAPAVRALNLSHELWRQSGLPLRRRLMRDWLWNLKRAPHPPGYEAVAEALKFADRGGEGAVLRTVERFHIVKRTMMLVAYPPDADPLSS